MALLELGIKEDPNAVHYPWAIRREATQEAIPAGTSMLEIFEQIGLGRSLLILGAPGAGKTTMLLELARLLIERARRDVTEPIPMVFNLSSWTEKQSLAEWLAAELRAGYTVSKKHAPTLIEGNKLLLLLDGLDEVRPESRAKCVEAINQFRKEHGLTSLAACCRSQEYGELKTQLAFDGAVEIQPLTAGQVDAYFERFGERLAGIHQALHSDAVLQEMAETPLFLSVMTLAYQDKQGADILVSRSVEEQRKHLFDTYITRMFERPERAKTERFEKQDVLRWLSWLAKKMIRHNQVPYLIERMQPDWLPEFGKRRLATRLGYWLSVKLIFGLFFGLLFGLIGWLREWPIPGLIFGLIFGLNEGPGDNIKTVDSLTWNRKTAAIGGIAGLIVGFIVGLIAGLIAGLRNGLAFGLLLMPIAALLGGLRVQEVVWATYPGQRLSLSTRNFLLSFLIFVLVLALIVGLLGWMGIGQIAEQIAGLSVALIAGLIMSAGWIAGKRYGGFAVIQHYFLRLLMKVNHLLPWKLIPFLDYCTDLVFLRRVGGGYIFVHRMLMEHFADMCPADEQ